MTADELDALMAQFTDDELLAAFCNRFRGVVVCTVKNDPLAVPRPITATTSIMEAQGLIAALIGHVRAVQSGMVKPDNNRPEGLKE